MARGGLYLGRKGELTMTKTQMKWEFARRIDLAERNRLKTFATIERLYCDITNQPDDTIRPLKEMVSDSIKIIALSGNYPPPKCKPTLKFTMRNTQNSIP